MNAAREKVRVARSLADLPKIEAGLARGELSYSKVRAMTRIADTGNEDYLLMIARHGTAHHVEKLVSKYRSARRAQDAAVADEQYRERELNHYYDHDGCLVIKARIPAEQGALIVKALEMAMENDFVAGDDSDNDSSDPRPEKSQPVAARRADALLNIAESYMNNDESSGSTADRYQVVVHVTAETSQLEDGPHVTAETSRRICCDSTVINANRRRRRRTTLYRSSIAVDTSADTARLTYPGRRMPLPGLYPYPLRRRASHRALGRRWRDQPGQPDPALQTPSSPGARRWFHVREVERR